MNSAAPRQTAVRRRIVADVMTREVVTIPPEAGFKEVVRLLAQRRVSGLPVIDQEGRLVGLVSEENLLPKERRLERPFLGDLRRDWREEHTRAEATTVQELMSVPAISVDERTPLQQAARAMHRHGVRRLCVVEEGGRLAGIVTRGDLLRAFVRPDEEIEIEIRDGVMRGIMWMDPTGVNVDVEDGVVRLTGEVERSSEAEILAALARGLDGVVAVDSRLTCRFDDRALESALPPPPLF